jgi:hypothetical protein
VKLTLLEIRSLIYEAIELSNDVEPTDHVDKEEVGEKVTSLVTDDRESLMSKIGEAIVLASTSLKAETVEEESDEYLKEFFSHFMREAAIAADTFDTSLEGQLGSAMVAKLFFEENIDKFPSKSRNYALDAIDLIEDYNSQSSNLVA